LESGVIKLELVPVQIKDSIEQVLARLEGLIAQRGVSVEVRLPDDFPEVDADPHRLDQVFFNLVENAVKYADANDPSVNISGKFTQTEVIVYVKDNGPGVPLRDQPHVFERFYRVEKDRNRGAGGTGLGLSIVKHVVRAHGGTVGLHTGLGAGSTFYFTLPVKQKVS
jgi:signal transduction histidine kinase